jgi:FAD/FMN-containing dehydrogenase
MRTETLSGSAILDPLQAILGDRAVLAGPAEAERRSRDYNTVGPPPEVVVYPVSTEEVSQVLKLCNDLRRPVVPQGGLTGLSGGATPGRQGMVALSLDRMRAIEEIDLDAAVITVQAGAVLQTVQDAADAASMLFPLDLGGRGSAQVGGLIGTNAGGNRVLRYGMMRDLVMGVEAVLADGSVVSSLNKMQKNNTGYDLKQLFIGSEGTLGVVTRANLKLFPKPAGAATALCGLDSYDAVLALLRRARAMLGGTLSAFEVMWNDFYEMGVREFGRRPLDGPHALYVLLDALGADPEADAARFEALITAAIEAGEVDDAVIAQSSQQTRELWKIRETPAEFPRIFSPHIPFDVSVPTGQIGDFAAAIDRRIKAALPALNTVYFGHVADSNLHVGVQTAHGEDPAAVKQAVYDVVRDFKGSISAEHGVGTEKKKYLGYSRSPAELALMRALKHTMDPHGVLNPGKVLI